MVYVASPAESELGIRVTLTADFQLLVDGRNIGVPHGVQRLLAFLAMARLPVHRSRVAGQLWPDVAEWRALGNLRSALWRLRRIRSVVVRSIGERLVLDAAIAVDLAELTELSNRLLDGDPEAMRRASDLVEASDILPGWEEEWLISERERFRELRLRALERACEAMIVRGDTGHGIRACVAAVEAEPFRESAQRLLVRLHLREGNRAAALRAYLAYRELVEHELGIEPSAQMVDLVAGLERRSPSSLRVD